MLDRLVYVSRRRSDEDGQIAEIEAVSRRNNARDGLTGALVHDERLFLQLLEGEHAAVARCFLRLSLSPLHGEIEILAFARQELRLFGDWSMRLVSAKGRTPSLAALVRRLRAAPEAERMARADALFLDLCD